MKTSLRHLHANLSRTALCIALALLPFTITGCHAALFAFLFLWILEGEWKEKLEKVRTHHLLLILLAFALINVLGLTYSNNSSEAWFSLERKAFLFLLPLALATTSVTWEEHHFRIVCYAFLAACLAGVVVCIASADLDYQRFSEQNAFTPHANYLNNTDFMKETPRHQKWLFYSYAGLSNGLKIHPSYFALYLAFCLIFLIHERTTKAFTKGVKTLLAALILILIVAIAFLSSKIIILCLLITCAFGCGVYLSRRGFRKYGIELAAVLFVMVLFVTLNPVSRYRTVEEFRNVSFSIKENHQYKTSLEIRGSLLWMGWKAYQHTNPVFGTGAGDVKSSIQTIAKEYNISNVLDTYDPHNQFLFILIANGMLGLTIFLTYLTLVSIKALRARNYLTIGFMILFVSMCLTESALELQKGVVFFAIIHSLLTFTSPLGQTNILFLKFSGAPTQR